MWGTTPSPFTLQTTAFEDIKIPCRVVTLNVRIGTTNKAVNGVGWALSIPGEGNAIHIVTPSHVVAGGGAIRAICYNKRYAVERVGQSDTLDIALLRLKIPTPDIQALIGYRVDYPFQDFPKFSEKKGTAPITSIKLVGANIVFPATLGNEKTAQIPTGEYHYHHMSGNHYPLFLVQLVLLSRNGEAFSDLN